MAKFHVCCNLTGIAAGTLNKKGDMFNDSNDVTEEAMDAVFAYLYQNKKELRVTTKDGKKCALRIVPLKDG